MTQFELPALGGAGSRFQTRENLVAEVRRVVAQEATARGVAVSGEAMARIAGDAALSDAIGGLSVDRRAVGLWDASSGDFPTTRPGGGAIVAGDTFEVSVGGTVDGVAFVALDRLVALGTGGATYAGNWFKSAYSDVLASLGTAPIDGVALGDLLRHDVRRYGADPTGATDSTSAFNAAAAAAGTGGVIYAPKGRYRLLSTVTLPGVFLMGDGLRSTFIDVGTDFSGSSIFKITGNDTGGGIGSLSIVGAQPSAPANRAALNTYPVAVDGSGVPRMFFDRVRLAGLTDGFDLTGNTGGTYIGRLELGCIGDALALDGLLDFLHIESIHAWPFGYTTPEQLAAYYDGMNIAMRLGKADGLSIDKFAVFRGAVVLEDPSSPLGILPARIGHLQLDGDGSRLVATNTRIKIDSMYSTKTTAPTATTLDVSGGVVDIGLVSMVGGENGKQINVTGGALRIGNGLIEHRRSDIGEAPIQASAGTLEIENTTFAWPSGTVRGHPMVAQSGTGTLILRGNRVAAPSATSPVVSVATDQAGHWIEADRLRPHTFTLPSSLALGRYFGAQNFTPTIVAATPGDLSIAYTSQTGRMRLDGDSYDLLIRLVFTPTFSTASGALTIGGLPFVVSNTSELPAAGFSGLTLSAGRTSCLLRVSASAATLLQSGPMAPLTVAQMASGTPVELFITGRGRL